MTFWRTYHSFHLGRVVLHSVRIFYICLPIWTLSLIFLTNIFKVLFSPVISGYLNFNLINNNKRTDLWDLSARLRSLNMEVWYSSSIRQGVTATQHQNWKILTKNLKIWSSSSRSLPWFVNITPPKVGGNNALTRQQESVSVDSITCWLKNIRFWKLIEVWSIINAFDFNRYCSRSLSAKNRHAKNYYG